MSFVEEAYSRAMDAMPPGERVARVELMLQWTRNLLARQVVAELGDVGPARVKWEVAMRMYGADPRMKRLLENHRPDASACGTSDAVDAAG